MGCFFFARGICMHVYLYRGKSDCKLMRCRQVPSAYLSTRVYTCCTHIQLYTLYIYSTPSPPPARKIVVEVMMCEGFYAFHTTPIYVPVYQHKPQQVTICVDGIACVHCTYSEHTRTSLYVFLARRSLSYLKNVLNIKSGLQNFEVCN